MFSTITHCHLWFAFVIGFLTFVFFFKQKTAYEMRISDWSSDVCSSDLEPRGRERDRLAVEAAVVDHARSHARAVHVGEASGAVLQAGQIGRASCRERVCQYV